MTEQQQQQQLQQLQQQLQQPSFRVIRELAAGGLSCMTGSALLNPMDVIKVRFQAQTLDNMVYKSFTHALQTIWKEEGIVGLYSPGLLASVIREACYSSLRIGLYPVIKKAIFNSEDGSGDIGFMKKFLAGMASGALGSALANPTDLVKIRLQVDSGKLVNGIYQTGLRKGHAPEYRNTFHAFVKIFKQEKIQGLYRGVEVTTLRAALLTAGQMASYDHAKHIIKDFGLLDEGIALHITGSLISGLVATTTSIPVDVIKTRVLNSNKESMYKNSLDCLIKTVKNEGLRALFKGWIPSYLRLGPHFIISMPLYEQCRHLFGLGSV